MVCFPIESIVRIGYNNFDIDFIGENDWIHDWKSNNV